MTEDRSLRLSVVHRAWRLLPARSRRLMFARVTALAAPCIARTPPPASNGLIVAGELSRASGLGESARLLLRGLDSLGIAAAGLDIGPLLPAHTPDLSVPSKAEIQNGAALALHVNPPLLPAVLARLPRGLVRRRRIIGCWVWELPAVSPEWHSGARFAHEVWTLSRFSASALEPLLPGRVRVVTPPLAIAPPRPASTKRADLGLVEETVVVLVALNLASSLERKNPLGAIAAFRAAFGNRPDRVLLLKIGNPEHAPQDFGQLQAAIAGATNIRLETRTLTAEQSHGLTAIADIVLSLHRSEGFGLVPAEAMLLGKPVIATGWSGNMDFMDHNCAALVDFRLVPVRDPRGVYAAPGAVWAEPNIEQAASLLRSLADDPGARAELGARGRLAAQQRLGPETLVDAIRALGLSVGQVSPAA